MKHFTQNNFKSSDTQRLSKLLTLLLFFFTVATVSFAQDPTADMKPKGETIQQIFEKRSYNGPMHKYPMASRLDPICIGQEILPALCPIDKLRACFAGNGFIIDTRIQVLFSRFIEECVSANITMIRFVFK